MIEAVLDASAVIADLQDEPGADVVRSVVPGALICAVNFAEVITKLVVRGMAEDEAVQVARRFGAVFAEVDEEQAVTAGLIHARTRRAGISMADAFCLALAKKRGLPVLTSDRGWKTLDIGVKVTLIR